ncbi:MAG: hypothetical protein Q9212_001375 [Teloschistes hypoglaucus]
MDDTHLHDDPSSHPPVVANFDSTHLVIGAGVAIFHLATSRVVVCYHSRHRYWFLPKGRRDAGEDTDTGAEREGYEESGYRNRLLPLPLRHRQPKAHHASSVSSPFVVEPVWTQLMPVRPTVQYMLFWYIAETLPPNTEASLSQKTKEENDAYQKPPHFPPGMTLVQRINLDEGRDPLRHENTGVDEEEALYESHLLSVEDATEKLRGTIMADVVRLGWEAICTRQKMEKESVDVCL